MQRITWIDSRLTDWAMWRLTGSSQVGRYSCPAFNVARVSQTDDVKAGLRHFDHWDDQAALLTDQAVAALPKELKQAVEMSYVYEGGAELAARKLGVTRATLHRRLCHADIRIADWFDTRLKKNEKRILPLIHHHA